MPLVEIIDVNRDGMNDLVFMDPNTNMLTVLYNQYEAQTYSAKHLCSDATPTSTLAKTPFFASYPFSDGKKSLLINMDGLFGEAAKGAIFSGLQRSDAYNPGRLRIADINTDGFPDIILTGKFIRSSDMGGGAEQFTLTQVLLNEPGAEGDDKTKKRSFKPASKD